MSIVRKKILYFGSDSEFYEKLEDFYHVKLMSPDTIFIQHEEEKLIDFFKIVIEEMPHLIMLDFSNDELFSDEKLDVIFRQIKFLKQNTFFKSIALTAFFSTQKSVKKYLGLSLYGVNYFFIKGTENILSFLDTCYIAFEQNVPIPPFAKAKNMELPYDGNLISGLSFVGKETLYIETDLEFKVNDEIVVENSLIDETFPVDLTIGEQKENTDFYFFNSYLIDIPFCGAWDEPSEKNIVEDTYSTWYDFALEDMELKKARILFAVQEKDALLSIESLCAKYQDYEIVTNEAVTIANLEARPSVIFLQLGEMDKDDEHIYDPLARLLVLVKRMVAYEPLIVLFSSPSTKDALSKAYLYSKIVTSTYPYSQKIVESMLDRLSKKLNEQEPVIKRFPVLREESVLRIKFPMKITSLTEHHITFFAEKGIPMYSIFTMNMPVPMIITIVPQIDFLPSKDTQEHYVGIINGTTVEQRATLRRFINYLIHNRPKVFDWVEPEEENEEQEAQSVSIDMKSVQVEEQNEPLIEKRDIQGESLKKGRRERRYEGKSKL